MATAKGIAETIGKEMLMPFISDIIALGFLGKKDSGHIIKDPEQAKAFAQKIAPHLFGIGLSDEALFNLVLAQLEDGRQREIAKFLASLSEYDQARFMLAITILPEVKDRIEILNMYSEMETTEEMTKLAKATHFISEGEGFLEKLTGKTKIAAIMVLGKMATLIIPVLKELDASFENAAKAIADWSGSKTRPSTNPVVRLANALFR